MEGKTLKEEVEAIDRKILDYCSFMEKELQPFTELTALDFKAGEMDAVGMTYGIQAMLHRAKNLAWAAQRFPLIDLSVFHQLQQSSFKIDGRDVALSVPKWVACHYPASESAVVAWRPANEGFEFFRYAMGYLPNMTAEVMARNAAAMGERSWNYLSSPVPATPIAIKRRVDPFMYRFDHVAVIAEAAWNMVEQKDPLVVGIIHMAPSRMLSLAQERYAFLLGEYDPTKMEKYVIAEFAVKPKG